VIGLRPGTETVRATPDAAANIRETTMSAMLITGGSGFIGSHCIQQLQAAGHQVRTTVQNLKREADVRAMLKAGA
jgi:NAD(P)-dependent dehydrogenase (short-subunit alcohol dehydrogenase family)